MKPYGKSLSKQRLRVWLKILQVSRAIERQVNGNFKKDFNTTLARFDVMSLLERFDGGLKMSEISTKMKVSNGNVTGIIMRLVDDGLAEQCAVAGDRRAIKVKLTKKGKEQFHIMAADNEKWVDEILNDMDKSDLELALNILGKI